MTLMNVAAYSLQLGVLVVAAVAVMFALRVRAPRPSLHFWQAVLTAAVMLPFLQPRVEFPAVFDAPLILVSATAPIAVLSENGVDLATLFIYVVAGGVVARLSWLAFGFVRLRGVVRTAAPAHGLQDLTRELTAAIGASATITFSDAVNTPATIGVRRPLILLPKRILEMPPAVQRAVIAHELLHVKRRDWLHTLLEEFWCAVLWFHPAARLLASRLSLSREMVVDQATLALTRDRRAYAEALLAFATPQPRLPGVTPLIGRRHVSQRISLITEETIMSRRRVFASFVVALSVCSMATASAVSVLPMTAVAVQAKKIYKATDGIVLPAVVKEVKPSYAAGAMQRKIQGSVWMAVVVLETGDVGEVRVTKPLDEELDQKAVEAAKQWKFKPGTKDGKAVAVEVTVEMTFTLKK